MSINPLYSHKHLVAIQHLRFTASEVLCTERERVQRMASLLTASTLESIRPTTVRLRVRTDEEETEIVGRIMATGDERIMLDGGSTVPIHCIVSIHF